MIRFIILTAAILTGCASKDVMPPPPATEIDVVNVDKNAPKATLAKSPPVLTGLWKSLSSEPAGNGNYVSREYSFTSNRWELTYTMAGDKELKQPFFVYKAEGAYTVENKSGKRPGSFLATFRNSRKSVLLKSKDRDIIKEHNLDSCKLEFGKDKDITATTCADFKSIKDCPQEFDLVKVENGNLFLGERPPDNDLCSEGNRPEGFGPGLKKLN